MSSIELFDPLAKTVQEGFRWPFDPAGGGGVPSVSSWRQWGHSWAASGFDDAGNPAPLASSSASGERHSTRISERIAGVMHLPPHAMANEARSGSGILGHTADGFGRVLQVCAPKSTLQNWPWEPDRFGVEAVLWGVNDIGANLNTGQFWAGQGAMWSYVWGCDMRSVISRFIAGAIYAADATGAAPSLWRTDSTPPLPNPVPMTSSPAFLPRGPGGVGAGSWVFKPFTDCNSGGGYWYTPANGDTVIINIPVDYDTGTIAIRHLCPGSWFDGPVQNRDPFGVSPPSSALPHGNVYTGAEHVLSPSAVTVVGGNINATVDCRGLANRGVGVNPGAGGLGAGAMTHVSRHALTPIPGTPQTLTLTVGGLPAGGWYGFDSWEIQARQEVRPIVVMANVANPASWWPLYSMWPQTVWALASAQAQAFSTVLSTICAEFADPGIMVADIRSRIATHPLDYGELVDTNTSQTTNSEGFPVEISSQPTWSPSGDGTHPHALGERLMIEAHLDALANANLPRGRGAVPFVPARSSGFARNASE